MSRLVSSICDRGEWALLETHWPGIASKPIGVLLREENHDRLHVKVRPEWWSVLPDLEEAELWRELAKDLEQQASKMGAARVLEWLESTASHTIQISTPQKIQLTTALATLEHLYQQHLEADLPCSEVICQTKQKQSKCLSPFKITNFLYTQYQSLLIAGWWAQAATVTLLLTVTLAGTLFHSIRSASPIPPTMTQELSNLPLWTGVHYQPVLLNINSEKLGVRPPVYRRLKTRRVASLRTRKFFRIDQVLVRPREVQLARLDPPLVKVETESGLGTSVLEALQPISIAKPYRARRNKFVRVLALVAAPFRIITR